MTDYKKVCSHINLFLFAKMLLILMRKPYLKKQNSTSIEISPLIDYLYSKQRAAGYCGNNYAKG